MKLGKTILSAVSVGLLCTGGVMAAERSLAPAARAAFNPFDVVKPANYKLPVQPVAKAPVAKPTVTPAPKKASPTVAPAPAKQAVPAPAKTTVAAAKPPAAPVPVAAKPPTRAPIVPATPVALPPAVAAQPPVTPQEPVVLNAVRPPYTPPTRSPFAPAPAGGFGP